LVNPGTLDVTIPRVSSTAVHSSAGVGAPWQASSYVHNALIDATMADFREADQAADGRYLQEE